MDLIKVLLNIVIQFFKGTLKNKSAFFFIPLIIIISGADSFSQDSAIESDKFGICDYESRPACLKQEFKNGKSGFLYNKFLPEPENSVFRKRDLMYGIINLDTSKKSNDTVITFRMKKNPWKAVLYSAILPGLGQFYNESYWKIPVVVAVGGYLGYVIVKNHGDYLDYRDLYAESQTPQNPDGDLRLKEFREFYRNQRDQFLLYFTFFYVITAVDAYVDANIYDFDVSDYMRLSVFKKNSILSLNIGF